MNHDRFRVGSGDTIKLEDYDPGFTDGFKNKDDAAEKLKKDVERLVKYQALLYAQNTHAVLIILQAMDTSGKDGVIRHVMSGLNPMGTRVHAFKAPSHEEQDHDYLWRCTKALPERGTIGVFNRSYYEEVLIVRVHPELLAAEKLPDAAKGKSIWKDRFAQINAYEDYLVSNGTIVLKFFLYLSKEEQRKRLLARIDTPEKNWKFSLTDVKERAHWDDYMAAYQDAINHTSTDAAPWYIVPADHKWFTRAVVADIIADKLKSLEFAFPTLDDAHMQELTQAKQLLESEAPDRHS